MRRGYLLPEGCKDLIDVLNMKEQQKFALSSLPTHFVPPKPAPSKPAVLPAIKGELIIRAPTSVKDLAEQLGQMPFKIIADLMALGVFASVSQVLPFETVSIIARQYGFLAKKAD
jgi:hypothetical protein